MNRSRVFVVCAAMAAAVGAGVVALAQSETGPAGADGAAAGERVKQGREGPGGPGSREPSVGGGMRAMNRAAKLLSRQLEDPAKRDENLKLINDMERGCVMAKGLPVPDELLEKAPDSAARAALSKDYHARLLGLLRALVELETAYTDGKLDEAKAKFASIPELKADAHKAVGLDDD